MNGLARFEIFQTQFQLLDLLVELFGFTSELHPFQLQDQQF
jgi:hypothetical protein